VPGNTAPLWKPVDQPLLTKLAERSRARIAKDVKFAEIIKNNKEAADKKGIIRLADLRKEMEKENGGKKKETPAEIKKKARDQYAPFINENINVLLDMVMLGSVPRI
jgi:carboxyl-terminal processing protease